MSQSNRPMMLLWVADPKAFSNALEAAGVAGGFEIVHVPPATPPDPDHLAKAEVLLSFGVPPGTLARMPRLRWLQSMTAGVDNWLSRPDLPTALPLTAARGTHRIQMPENILGALFHITKPYHTIALNQSKAKWIRSGSTTLAGKTLGILGLGAIGVELARKAAALEMRVVATKRIPGPQAHVAQVYPPSQTDAVLAQSDYVVLLLPVTPDTESMINRQRLAAMKKSAWLINFGRGALIADDDLIAAVKAGDIAGAVLDVFRTEPLPEAHPFWRTPGITVLPHIGGVHPERDQWVAALFAENARRFLGGEPLKELVDRDKGY